MFETKIKTVIAIAYNSFFKRHKALILPLFSLYVLVDPNKSIKDVCVPSKTKKIFSPNIKSHYLYEGRLFALFAL
jgi:hypothetical protein